MPAPRALDEDSWVPGPGTGGQCHFLGVGPGPGPVRRAELAERQQPGPSGRAFTMRSRPRTASVRAGRAGAVCGSAAIRKQLRVVTDGDVADPATSGGQDDGDPVAGQLSGWER
jgi:hypothetical protein